MSTQVTAISPLGGTSPLCCYKHGRNKVRVRLVKTQQFILYSTICTLRKATTCFGLFHGNITTVLLACRKPEGKHVLGKPKSTQQDNVSCGRFECSQCSFWGYDAVSLAEWFLTFRKNAGFLLGPPGRWRWQHEWTVSNGRVIRGKELEMMLQEAVVAWLSRNLSGITEWNHENLLCQDSQLPGLNPEPS
jgi:hypothetical protein